MRIQIEKQIDAETKELWSFNMFDLNAVFVAWHREVKPKSKRKWTIEKFWDKYGRRKYNMVSEPVLPEIIRSEVLSEVMKYVRVHTWDEWKARFKNKVTMEHEKSNKQETANSDLGAVSGSFSISTIQSFLEFEKEQKKIMRGNIEMYDIKGHHKYLTFAELFNWYVSRF